MLKALFGKQMKELGSWLLLDRKTGKPRSKGSMVGYIILYIILFAMFMSMFFGMSSAMCAPLVSVNMGWLYHAIICLVSVALGVFGSVFSTFSTLYLAKDNDFLLSLPIPPSKIMLVRLFGVWLWGFIYEALVLIPAMVVYWITVPVSVPVVLADLLVLLLVSFFILTLSCLLGWVVAKISIKLKNKSFITVLVSIAFMAAYFYVYSNSYKLLENILANVESFGDKIYSNFAPLYWLGRGAEGDWVSLLLVGAIIIALLALVWWVLSHSFLKLATNTGSNSKKAYRVKSVKAGSIQGALLKKEAKRLTSSANCMLNCCIASLFLLAAAVFIVIKGSSILETVKMGIPGIERYVPILACAIICFIAGVNDYTAASVSLEGHSIWIVQSLPVTAWQVLKAKLALHLIVTAIPALICSICAAAVLKADMLSCVLLIVFPQIYVMFFAALGLLINLKHPNLTWTNEIYVVKQGIGVFIMMFGSMMTATVLFFLYFWASKYITPEIYVVLLSVVFGLLSVLCLNWIKNKGSEIFEKL